jgi:hypothetical protein
MFLRVINPSELNFSVLLDSSLTEIHISIENVS